MRQIDQIPTYDQAAEALNNGDKGILEEALFAFKIDDGYYIEQVTKAIQALFNRPDLTPHQIVSIGRALHGLKRLPLRTPGLDVHLSLVDKLNGECTTYDLYINEDHFSTETGGYVNFGGGTDSISEIILEVEPHFHGYEGWNIASESWPNVFNEMTAAKLEIEDESEDSLLDWGHPDGSVFWEWIAKHD